MRRVVGVALLAGMLVAFHISAKAAGPQDGAFARWKAEDKCVAEGQRKFPDRDIESQRKRDDAVNRCLVNSGLPARATLAPK
jgi:hypothetical protein